MYCKKKNPGDDSVIEKWCSRKDNSVKPTIQFVLPGILSSSATFLALFLIQATCNAVSPEIVIWIYLCSTFVFHIGETYTKLFWNVDALNMHKLIYIFDSSDKIKFTWKWKQRTNDPLPLKFFLLTFPAGPLPALGFLSLCSSTFIWAFLLDVVEPFVWFSDLEMHLECLKNML